MRRRRINLTKERLNNFIVKVRRRYLKLRRKSSVFFIETINNEFD